MLERGSISASQTDTNTLESQLFGDCCVHMHLVSKYQGSWQALSSPTSARARAPAVEV